MQRNKKRKGFTLTELAIVIAVIAILIAVLVPTFTSLITSANESADQQAVKSMNTALATDEALTGTPVNPKDAMQVIENAGYTVKDYVAFETANTIYWDSTTNRCLIWTVGDDGTGSVTYPSDAVTKYKDSAYTTSNIPKFWYQLSDAYDTVTYDSTKSFAENITALSSGDTLQFTNNVTLESRVDSLTGSDEKSYSNYYYDKNEKNSSNTSYVYTGFITEDELSTYKTDNNLSEYTFTKANYSSLSSLDGSDIEIDLNGYTFTNYGILYLGNGSSLTLRNGTYEETSIKSTTSNINITEGSSVTLDGVTMSVCGAALYPQGDSAQVNVINSTITTSGAYCVATNAATVDNYNVIITIDNSTLTCGYTPICFNVPGSYSVTNSIIQSTSASPSVIIRGGTATIDNCKIYNNFTNYLDKAYVIWNARMDDWTKQDTSYTYGTAWGSGNATAYAVLCIGNDADSTSYQYATNCTVTNTEIHANKGYMCVYVEGNNKEANGATFNYSNCSFYYHGSVAPYNDTTGGTAYSNVTPTEYISSLYDSTNTTNPLNYAIIYTSDTASYVTINGTVYQDGE